MDPCNETNGAPGISQGPAAATYEIPFWLRSTEKPKWVSGIDHATSCSDVLISLLSSKLGSESGGGPASPSKIARDFTLVEQWRGVERALSRSSKILKLWLAWGEEKDHVKFVVKRIHSSSKTTTAASSSAAAGSSQPRDKPVKQRHRVRRRNSGSSSIVSSRVSDTLHPKKIARAVNSTAETGGKRSLQLPPPPTSALSQNIEDMMKIILSQGRLICNELHRLDDPSVSTLSPRGESQHAAAAASSSTHQALPFQQSVPSRRKSKSVQALDEVDLSFELFEEEQLPPEVVEEMARTRSLTMELARVHAMNEELQNVETKLHILTSNYLQMRRASSNHEQVSAKARDQLRFTENALSQLRMSNDKAMGDITKNKELLGSMEASYKAKKEAIKQLEYDVNVIEKEGRKLTKEFDKVMSIRIPEIKDGDPDCSGFEDSQVIYSELKELQLECGNISSMDLSMSMCDPDSSNQDCHTRRIVTTASPEGSTSGVSSGTEDGAGNSMESKTTTTSSKNKLCVSDNRMVVGLKNGGGGKHLQEDSNSDTGLSSLHSSSDEGSFEFGTLV